MHKLSHRIALIAFAGTMAATGTAFAAPPAGPGPHPQLDCSLAQNANNPFCAPNGDGNRKGRHYQGGDNNGGNQPNHDQQNNNGGNQQGNGGNWQGNGGNWQDQHPNGGNWQDRHPNGGNPPPPQGGNGPPNGFHWSQHDRDQFHRQYRGFNFGFFGAPGFSIQLGTAVPHSYELRPVPRAIYRAYPQFRGYLFFTTRRGDVVIVSPKSHRIIAVI